MKKLFFLGALFAVGLGFTACSSDKDEATETNILDKFDAKGEAKVCFRISTAASSQATRAGENSANDNYVVGDANEYVIKDATLVLFQGSSEAAATFVNAYPLTATSLGIQDYDVSDLYTATITNQGISGTNLYALIVANGGALSNSVLVKSGDDWKLNGTTLTTSTTFSTFQTTELAAAKLGNQTTGMLMSNAPQSTMKGGSVKPTLAAIKILVTVSAENIAQSESTASANPIRVFVERAAAKVQVEVASGVTKVGTTGPTFASADVKWVTDNKEATFYTVRVPSAASGNSSVDNYYEYTNDGLATPSYRFFSEILESNRTDTYRLYWAIDPHYDYNAVSTSSTTALVGSVATDAEITNATGASTYEYITENTFNEFGLTKDRTTRVLLSITFNGGNDFFTVNGADGIFLTGDCTTDGTLAKKLLEYVVNLAAVQTWITTNTKDQSKITVEVTAPTAAGAVPNANVVVKYDGATDADLTTAAGNVATNMNAICYKGGKAYYQARIKHFGDTHTPLGAAAGSTYNQLYGDPSTSGSNTAKNFLGRYSVVRNNWYILKVTAVKQLGSATIPTPDYTPDDDNNQYITTEIYVNKWAQRTQDVELY